MSVNNNKAITTIASLPRLVGKCFQVVLTDSAKVLVLGFILSILAGTLTLSIPLYHVFTTVGALGAVTFLMKLMFWPKVNLTSQITPQAVAGQEIICRFTMTNRSQRRPIYDLSLEFFSLPDSIMQTEPGRNIPRLGPGETVPLEIRLTPRRRGLYDIPSPIYFSTFPLNFFRAGPTRKQHSSRLIVLPSFHPIEEVAIPVGTRYQPGGIALTSNIGESPEYIGNRDFRPGDSLRRLDSRAWARLAKPVVKEYNEEYYCRVAVVLDTFVPPARRCPPTGFTDLEAAVSLTAAVADAMSRGEYIIDIFAAGPDLYVFQTGRHTAHFHSVLEILAGVEACRTNPFDIVGPALADELNNISAVVFLLLDWDKSREALVRTAVEAGCSVRVIIVRAKDTTVDYRSAEDWAGRIEQLSPEFVQAGGLERL